MVMRFCMAVFHRDYPAKFNNKNIPEEIGRVKKNAYFMNENVIGTTG